ncbi:MAG: UDP-2,3-diacylglucosamine diphosphatase LpxI [Nitrospirota bacterium]
MDQKIGLIAGNGNLPVLFVDALKARNHSVFVIAHKNETRAEIAKNADDILWVPVGQIAAIIPYFKQHQISEIVMAGGIPKTNLFDRVLDPSARQLVDSFKEKKDDLLLRGFASAFEKAGMKILSVTDFLPDLLAQEGEQTRPLTKSERDDIEWGWGLAKQIGALDIGQTIVVKEGVLLAVEAVEGTDAAIRRGGQLGRSNVRVIKCLKPHQDVRFDLPTVGVQTIQTMIEANASVLAVEAGRTLLLEKEAFLKAANEAGIAVVGWKNEPPPALAAGVPAS